LVTRSGCHLRASSKEAPLQCCTPGWISAEGKIDVCLLSGTGEHLDQLAISPDADSLRRLARRIDEVHAEPVCAVVESMTSKLSAATSARVGVGHCPHVDVHGDPWAGSLHHPRVPLSLSAQARSASRR
jgi:hypothetical protein